MKKKALLILLIYSYLIESNAFLLVSVPNVGSYSALQKIEDELEIATDIKALAVVGETSSSNERRWIWGISLGNLTQSDANKDALNKCESLLATLKNELTESQPRYNFGDRKCELHNFWIISSGTLGVGLGDADSNINNPSVTGKTQITTDQISKLSRDGNSVITTIANPLTGKTVTIMSPAIFPNTTHIRNTSRLGESQPTIKESSTNSSDDIKSVEKISNNNQEQKYDTNIYQRMKVLESLYSQNLITKDEYEFKKKQLLDQL